jgi:hypothetical protein
MGQAGECAAVTANASRSAETALPAERIGFHTAASRRVAAGYLIAAIDWEIRMLASVRNLRTSELELRQRLPALECDWLVGLRAKRG